MEKVIFAFLEHLSYVFFFFFFFYQFKYAEYLFMLDENIFLTNCKL